MAARGLSEEGNFVQNTLGSVVSHTPAFLSNMVGLQYLFQVKYFQNNIFKFKCQFKVAKAGDCAEFQCSSY